MSRWASLSRINQIYGSVERRNDYFAREERERREAEAMQTAAQVARQLREEAAAAGEVVPPPAREFFLGGRACFTLSIPADFAAEHKTPKQYVYRISKVEANPKYPEAYFVSMLVGANNETDFQYIGQLDSSTGEVRTTHKSKVPADSMAMKLLNRALANVWRETPEKIQAAGFELLHSGKCGKCGRVLTDRDSIAAGLGPTCRGKE